MHQTIQIGGYIGARSLAQLAHLRSNFALSKAVLRLVTRCGRYPEDCFLALRDAVFYCERCGCYAPRPLTGSDSRA
jgi:hypothetical protein